jgi:hypothetical protein
MLVRFILNCTNVLSTCMSFLTRTDGRSDFNSCLDRIWVRLISNFYSTQICIYIQKLSDSVCEVCHIGKLI